MDNYNLGFVYGINLCADSVLLTKLDFIFADFVCRVKVINHVFIFKSKPCFKLLNLMCKHEL